MIEGFLAHGTRTTTTVPALPGHAQPVQVITETWCAKELGAVLHNSHSDPRVGDVVTRLQGVQQMHPPGHLFQVPHDYRVLDSARPAVPHL
jgi:hypothetical protein